MNESLIIEVLMLRFFIENTNKKPIIYINLKRLLFICFFIKNTYNETLNFRKQNLMHNLFNIEEIIDFRKKYDNYLKENWYRALLIPCFAWLYILIILLIVGWLSSKHNFTWFTQNTVNILNWLFLIIFTVQLCWLIRSSIRFFYYLLEEPKELLDIKFLIKFAHDYGLRYPQFSHFRKPEEIKELQDMSEQLHRSEHFKDRNRVIINFLKKCSKDILIEVKYDLIDAREKEITRFQQGIGVLLAIILLGMIYLILFLLNVTGINFNDNHNQKTILDILNSSLGMSPLVFIALPFLKSLLENSFPSIEIYNKCILLINKSIG